MQRRRVGRVFDSKNYLVAVVTLREMRIKFLLAFGDFAQTELNQMTGLEFAPGPAISLCKFNPDEIFHRVEPAVYYTRLASIRRKFHGNSCVRLNLVFHFQACARGGYIIQDAPLALCRAGFRFPLNFDKVCAKFPVFTSFRYHALFIGKNQPRFRVTRAVSPKKNRFFGLQAV